MLESQARKLYGGRYIVHVRRMFHSVAPRDSDEEIYDPLIMSHVKDICWVFSASLRKVSP